jgi:predicted nucleic acid-binding protein
VHHLRCADAAMQDRLDSGEILMHPFVLGEISLGNLTDRKLLLYHLSKVPLALVAHDREVVTLIESLQLYGTGIGYVDAHLLATAMLMESTRLWTRDRRFLKITQQFGIAAEEPEARLQ